MRFELRDYQRTAVDKCMEYLSTRSDKNGIAIAPTGSGKSLMLADLADRVEKIGYPTIIFQPSREILAQNAQKLINCGKLPSIFSASLGRRDTSKITLATIGSAVRHLDLFNKFEFVIVDECHLVNSKNGKTYRIFINHMRDHGVRVIGFTGTPYRLHVGAGGAQLKFLTRTRPRVFSDVIHVIQTRDLYDAGYLAKLEYDSRKIIDFRSLEINNNRTDYTDYSIRKHYKEISYEEKLIREVDRLLDMGRKRILVFTRFISEAKELNRHLIQSRNDENISAFVTSDTKRFSRDSIVARFKDGQIKVVSNVGVLFTGFDYPQLDTVVLGRPTMSLQIYVQQAGRCSRPHAKKDHSLIVDLCGLVERFGKVEDMHICENGSSFDKGWAVYDSVNGTQLTNVLY